MAADYANGVAGQSADCSVNLGTKLTWQRGSNAPVNAIDALIAERTAERFELVIETAETLFLGSVDRAQSAIESDRFRMLVLDTAAWIEAGDWMSEANDPARKFREQSIATVAAVEMEHRRRKIMKRGSRLAKLDPERRHRIRIQAKKLRYASEFLGSAFPGKKAAQRRRELVAGLARLQDRLGDLNDISVHEELAERIAIALDNVRKRNFRSANKTFAAGRLSGREEARIASVLKSAEHAYARFARAKPFWR